MTQSILENHSQSTKSLMAPFAAIALVVCVLVFNGCAVGYHRITSTPSGADVYRKGLSSASSRPEPHELRRRGLTPYTYGGGPLEGVWYQARMQGYKDSELVFMPAKPFGKGYWHHFELIPLDAPTAHAKLPVSEPRPQVPHDSAPHAVVQPSRSADARQSLPFAQGQRWAVVVGISDYLDSRVPSLRYAAADAQAFAHWLCSREGGRFPPARVKLLVNKQATCRAMKNAFFVWLKQALQEDTVVIFFAGHGSPESPDSPDNLFLLPYDTEYNSLATTAFPMWDIETALKRFIRAKRVVVIADACHSGGVGQSFDIARRAKRGIKLNKINSSLNKLSELSHGVCVISASDDKQFSQESKRWGGGHGVFTHFLLKGLKGEADYNKDRSVSLGELIPYLSENVRRATKNAQSPTVAGKFDPSLSIGR